MGLRRPICTLGLALAIVLVTLQSPVNASEQCRTGCGKSQDTLKYAVGTTYKYNYNGKIDISLSSAEGQLISTEVKAVVLLTQQPNCVQVLELQNVQILGNGGKKLGPIPDIEKPILINNKDGLIEDSICTDPTDTQNSLNIKRAIASAFLVNQQGSHETDVFGLCPTDVSSTKEGAVLTIQKSRNLNKCAFRENIKQDFLATTFNKDSEIKSSPILNADYSAKQKIKNGIIESVQIVENYLYVPFSVGKNGAKAQVNAKLELAGNSKTQPKAGATKPKSIIFDNPHPVNVAKGAQNTGAILEAVKKVAQTIDATVSETTAKEFINLIKILRVSNKDSILTVFSQVKSGAGLPDKEGAKKIFIDALLRAGNGDAIEVVVELLKKKEITDFAEKKAYIGLSLATHVTEKALLSAGELLNNKNLPREAYLGIGNLAGKYCRHHTCENVPAVNKLTDQLIAKLGDNKAANRNEESEMISVLKALGNFRHLNDKVAGKIAQLAKDQTSTRLRVVALETILADPCQDKLRDTALNVLQDVQLDSEIRIKAYLAAVACPNAKIGNAVKALLEKEPSYQVGGFIVSHIRNLRASANPDKEIQKQHLGFINLPQRFPIDFRKWSYNGEFSYAFDTLGVASASEANIIYSQNSWLPRSTSLNLTAEVFGHNVNFLEIETRQENLDRLIGHYFGPKGVLRSPSLQALFKEKEKPVKDLLDQVRQKVEKSLRARRDVSKAEIQKISKEVTLKESTFDKDLDLDLSIKAFGSEVLFLNVNENVQKWTPDAVIDRIVSEFTKGLDKLKNFEDTLRTNLIFLDGEFDYPTSLGFPLRLAVEGSATVQVKAKGSIDVRALVHNKDTGIKLSLIPSANVEVSGRLTLDAFVVESGLKVASTLHSALGGDLNLEVFNNGDGLQVKYNIPVEKQTLLSANHEVVAHTRELGAREVNTPLKFAQNKDFSICVDHLKDYVGLEFCGEYSGPNLSGKQVPILPFPLAGDANVKVEIIREDVKEYVFRQVVSQGANKLGGEIELSTIGKNGQKKTSVQLVAQLSPERFIKAEFLSPKYTALAEARVTSNDREKSILGRLNYFKNEFYGKVGVSITGTPAKSIYKPILEYKTPEGGLNSLKTVEGQIIVEQNGPNTKYTFDNLKIAIPSGNKQLIVKGDFGKENSALYTNLDISDGKQSASLKGRLQVTAELAKINAELKNSFNPNANVKIQGEFKKGKTLESHLTIIHGADLSSKSKILTLTNSFFYNAESPNKFELTTKNHLTYPALNLDVKLDVEEKPKSFEAEANLQYGEVKLGSEIDIEIDQKEKGDYKFELELYGLDNKLELKSSRQIVGHDCKIDNTLELNGKKFEVKGKVKHIWKPQNIDVAADLIVVLPTHNAPFKITSVLKYDTNTLDASDKIVSGNTVILDFFLKANKQGNANGSIKVNLKNVLAVNGQVKANKGAGNGDILIDLQSLKKQVKAETTFNIQVDKSCSVSVTLYPLFNEDKNKKIVLSTQNTYTEHDIDSKNVVDIIGSKFVVNFKGARQGEIRNGKVNGEVEVILPNEQYFLGKVNRDIKTANDLTNGQFQASLEHRKNKNTPGNKLSLKGTVKNTNLREKLFDVEYNLSVDDSNGKSLNSDLALKRSKQGEEDKMEVRSKVYGSVLQNALESSLVGNCRKGLGNFEVKTTYGPGVVYALQGKYDVVGESRPYSGSLTLDVKTPSKILGTLKVSGSGSIKKARSPTDHSEFQGSYSIFADDDGSTPEPIIDVSSDYSLKGNERDGQLRGSLKYGKKTPITVALGYSKKEGEDTKQVNINGAIQYDQNKNIKADLSLQRLPGHEYKLVGQLDTPIQNHKSNKIVVHTKRGADGRSVQSNVELISDGKKYTLDSDLTEGPNSGVDIKLRNPEGKLAQFLLKQNYLNEKQFDQQLKIVNEAKNFLLEADVNFNVEGADDFHIKGNLHSPSLKLEKIVFEAQTKPGSNGRKIQVNIKSANKNLLSGVTSYQIKKEGGKTIVEGSGSFQVKEETKSGNFKFISQRLSPEKNQEQGIDVSFDGKLGNKAIDAEFKLTNKQFRILNSFCEEKKECAHFEVDSKSSSNGVQHYNQELEINVDLRKLGLSHEFGLKSVTNRDGYIVDHTVDVHFQSKEKSKYQYSLYVHPKEAGWSLTTPKRTVALEAKSQYPKTWNKEGGRVSLDVVFYLDKKNQPNKKTSLNTYAIVSVPGKNFEGEVKFSNPGLPRPLSASVKSSYQGDKGNRQLNFVAEVDVFAQPAQKLVITQNSVWQSDLRTKGSLKTTVGIKSTGLGVNINFIDEYAGDRENFKSEYLRKLDFQLGKIRLINELSWQVSKTQANLLLKLINVDLLKVTNKLNINKEQQIIDTEVVSYDNNPVVSHLEVKNWNTLKYEVGHKKTPNKKLVLSSGLITGQIADTRGDLITPGGKVNLYHASLKLDDANFLKPDYGVDSKKIQDVITAIRTDITNYLTGLREQEKEMVNTGKKISNEVSEIAKRAVPNLTPLKEYYSTELKKLKEEIVSDKTIKDITEFLKSIFGAVSQVVTEIFTKFSDLLEHITKALQTSFSKVLESIEKELIPQLQKISKKVLDVVSNVVNTAADIILGVLVKINEIIEKYQPEIKQLATALSGLTQDVGRFVVKAYQSARTTLVEQYKKIYNEIKALPLFEELKNQYDELVKKGLPNADAVLGILKEVLNSIYEILPANLTEIKTLLHNIEVYLEKKLKNLPVDDIAELDKIIKSAVAVVKKILDLISADTNKLNLTNPDYSLNFGLLSKLPRFVAIKFSPLSHILKEESSGYVDFLLSLVTRPRNLFAPFPLVGLIGQGQSVFTFDGKLVALPTGTCNYLLARDALNGNFNLVSSHNKGLTSITLSDGKDQITLKKGGQVQLNSAPSELPIRKETIAAYRDYYVIILKTNSGVEVTCNADLSVCAVQLSGFYHGQIRGLLGNGNNDPFDDFTAPSGQILTEVSKLAQTYQVGSCQAGAAVDIKQIADAPACSKLFSWESSLRLCYQFVKPDNFKAACSHGVASGVKETEENIAKLYVTACADRNIPVSVPEELVKCRNGEVREVGQKYSVKLPSKSADIVILVDTVKANEKVYKELVQPLITEILKELHGKSINDVEFHLITYGGENQWPSHVTVNGKLQFKGKPPNIKFADEPKHEPIRTQNDNLNKALGVVEEIIRSVKLALGIDLQAETYAEALKYPFRSNAVKSVIAVTSQPCETGHLILLQKLRAVLFRNNQIKLNLITPFETLNVKDVKKTKDVVGFNNDNVFTLSQGKKKPEGSSELHKDLQYDDFCVDFTIKNNGNVFVTNNFLTAKGDSKVYVSVAAHNIVDQLISQESGLDCECKLTSPWGAENVCVEIYSKERSKKTIAKG